MLKIENLQVHYGGIQALRGISLEVPEGEIVTTDYSAQIEGDNLKVTLVAECREEIGQERETRAISNGPEPEQGSQTQVEPGKST